MHQTWSMCAVIGVIAGMQMQAPACGRVPSVARSELLHHVRVAATFIRQGCGAPMGAWAENLGREKMVREMRPAQPPIYFAVPRLQKRGRAVVREPRAVHPVGRTKR